MGAVAAPAVHRELFGSACGAPVERYTFDTGPMQVSILSPGGILHSVRVPDRDGRPADVILALADPVDHATAGPHLIIDGGGAPGSDAATAGSGTWTGEPFVDGDRLGLRLACADPADGVRRAVTYTLHGTEIRIDRAAEADAPAVLQPSGQVLFNLAGEGSGSVEEHELYIDAGHYTPVDPTRAPTGRIDPVAGTPLDFTRPTPIGARLREDFVQLVLARGYDHTYLLDRAGPGSCLAARVAEPRGGRRLSVFTTGPCLRFYSGNLLDGTLAGARGRAYRQGDGFSLETQLPSTVLRPGEVHRGSTVYRFDLLSAGA
ncbi:aldose 1-epimerase [Virgisporangium aliadipatigenens]|uniref:Aldose 1-epimerase n=1 Tax=Virgisporangium aliadipatigenens TaxID=741659 RepID=A0A8J3YRM0_9ACTN|nr:galactose-1-epimerase [Virgisporangium aliadipatigenens]GIJ49128.1 aldose 1-epimerase [Virgisporangium aliadipatigenens]